VIVGTAAKDGGLMKRKRQILASGDISDTAFNLGARRTS
jgi:hypothetical protein